MGYWNETCLLSRLPITCGQEIVCVFITPVNAWPGTVYADSQYVPLSLPFVGRYDDYGRIENTEYNEAAIKSLSNTALWRLNGDEWEPVRPPIVGSPYWSLALTDLSDMARQGNLWVCNDTSVNGHAQVRLAFFHKDLWDYAVKQKLKPISNECIDTLAHKWPAAKDIEKTDKPAHEALKALATMDTSMNLMRVAWQPTCGTGHQSCVDYPWQVRLYKKFAERANAFYKNALD